MNLDQLTQAVWDRLEGEKPRALLLGDAPPEHGGYTLVRQPPYEAVILGILSPGELLHMPTDPVCQALLEEKPVLLWPQQPYRQAKTARLLCRELAAAEQHLKQLGVRPMKQQGRLITAQEAQQMRHSGLSVPPGCRMTPLAREIMEGSAQ